MRGRKTFTPFVDQFGAPTWTRDIADMTLRLLQHGATGTYHYAYDDAGSWFDVYSHVKAVLGLDTELTGKESRDVRLPARRPLYSVLSNKKLKDALGETSPGSWRDRLTEFLLASTPSINPQPCTRHTSLCIPA